MPLSSGRLPSPALTCTPPSPSSAPSLHPSRSRNIPSIHGQIHRPPRPTLCPTHPIHPPLSLTSPPPPTHRLVPPTARRRQPTPPIRFPHTSGGPPPIHLSLPQPFSLPGHISAATDVGLSKTSAVEGKEEDAEELSPDFLRTLSLDAFKSSALQLHQGGSAEAASELSDWQQRHAVFMIARAMVGRSPVDLVIQERDGFQLLRVQVVYYALLRTGHLDVYVGSREAAPAHVYASRQCGASPCGTSAGLLPWPGIHVQARMERRLVVGVARQVLQPGVNRGYPKCFVGWVASFVAGLMNGVHF